MMTGRPSWRAASILANAPLPPALRATIHSILARTHQIEIAGKGEGAARNDDVGVRQRQRSFGSIDKPQRVGVLRPGAERRKMLAANGEEDAGALFGKRSGGGATSSTSIQLSPGDRFHGARSSAISAVPVVAQAATALRLISAANGWVASTTCVIRLPPDVVGQAARAAEAADARRQRLRQRGLGAAGIGIDRVKPERARAASASRLASLVPPRMRARIVVDPRSNSPGSPSSASAKMALTGSRRQAERRSRRPRRCSAANVIWRWPGSAIAAVPGRCRSM